MGTIRDDVLSNIRNTQICRQQILDMLDEVASDMMQVFDFGNRKHPDSGNTPNFLTPNGNKCSITVRGNSLLHHSADVRAGVKQDHESGLHPALHLIASAVILYIRQKRNIIHPDDLISEEVKERTCNRDDQVL